MAYIFWFTELKLTFLNRSAAKLLIIVCFLATLPGIAFAQYDNESDASVPLEYFYIKRDGNGWFRKVISKLTFGVSTGFGSTTFRHELSGFGIYQNPGAAPQLFETTNLGAGYSNWFNKVTNSTSGIQPGAFQVSGDTAKIGFKSKAFNIPLKATLHVDFDKIRIGGGYSLEMTQMNDFKPINYGDKINNYSAEFSSFLLQKYFGMIGGTVYRYNEYLLVVDANIGGYNLGNKFDKSVIQKGIYLNLGVAIEREMSEYFRLFVRPSYEIKSYKLSIPETSHSITHKFNAFYLNVGATYRFPELRRCFLKTCKIQMNHAHGNKEYRSRVHPIYKKQNPHYGENHPNLIKYKGKNKYKLNPY